MIQRSLLEAGCGGEELLQRLRLTR